MKTTLSALTLLVCSLPAVAATKGRPPVETVLSTLHDTQDWDAAEVSPDGTRVAWVKKIRDRKGAWKLAAVEIAEIAENAGVGKAGPAAARRITGAADGRAHDEHDPAWSADGKRVAFLSDAAKEGQAQIWIAPAAGGAARRLTHVTGQLNQLRWSPDGRSIAFLFVEGSSQEIGALTAYKPDSGLVEETVDEQRIAVADVATGKVRSISPEHLYVYDYDWSPDGKRFAAEAAEGSGTNNYWIAHLDVVDAASGAATTLWKPPLQIACPRWSPDGSKIAVIHGLMSDEGQTGGDIWTVPASRRRRSREPHAGHEGFRERSLLALPRRDPVHRVRRRRRGGGHARGLRENRDPLERTGRAQEILGGAEKHRLRGDPLLFSRCTGDRRRAHRGMETADERECRDPASLGRGEEPDLDERRAHRAGLAAVSDRLRSGTEVPDGRRSPRRPFGRRRLVLADALERHPLEPGLFRLDAQPARQLRTGRGVHEGNVKDFGYGDFRDIERGVDEAIAAAPVDPKRLGIARLELRRLHDDVGGHPDEPLTRRPSRAPES